MLSMKILTSITKIVLLHIERYWFFLYLCNFDLPLPGGEFISILPFQKLFLAPSEHSTRACFLARSSTCRTIHFCDYEFLFILIVNFWKGKLQTYFLMYFAWIYFSKNLIIMKREKIDNKDLEMPHSKIKMSFRKG